MANSKLKVNNRTLLGMKSLLNLGFITFAAISFIKPAMSFANSCGSSVTLTPISVNWNTGFNSIPVTLTIHKTAPGACDVYLTFGKGHASDYNRYGLNGSNQLFYQLYSDVGMSNILKDQADITNSSQYIMNSFSAAPNQTVTKTYYFQVPYALATSPTYVPYGTYTDNVSVKVFENPVSPSAIPTSTSTLSVSVTIPQIIEMAFGSGSTFNSGIINQTLNFGDITTTKTQTTSVQVRSNAGWAISMSSTNGGQMKNSTYTSSPNIPYTMNFNSSTSTLTSSPVVKATGSTQTSTSGVSYPLSITTITTPSALNGNYSDSISITAITTL